MNYIDIIIQRHQQKLTGVSAKQLQAFLEEVKSVELQQKVTVDNIDKQLEEAAEAWALENTERPYIGIMGYISGYNAHKQQCKTYIPLICKKSNQVYTWTISTEGDHWIDTLDNRIDINPDECHIVEVKLSNNQIITQQQCTTDAMQFAEWTREQEHLGYIVEDKLWGYTNDPEDTLYTTEQFYQLWLDSKNAK